MGELNDVRLSKPSNTIPMFIYVRVSVCLMQTRPINIVTVTK